MPTRPPAEQPARGAAHRPPTRAAPAAPAPARAPPRGDARAPDAPPGVTSSRRAALALAAAAALAPLRLGAPPGRAEAAEELDAVPPGAAAEVEAFFAAGVEAVRRRVGAGFDARLVVYGSKAAALPSGAPGDPARDYRTGAAARCGVFRPAALRPYDCCPAPGEPAAAADARACCRHYAYCVPPSRLALAAEDRVASVVVARRLLALQPRNWRAVLAHELGHAADFYLYGSRYPGLRSHAPDVGGDASLLAELQRVDAEEADPELRADALGELLVLAPLTGARLCYDTAQQLQTEAGGGERCDGGGLVRHFSHAPISGGGLPRRKSG